MADDKLLIKSKRKLHGEDGYSVFSIRIRSEIKDKIDKILLSKSMQFILLKCC